MKAIFGQIQLFNHERSPVELSNIQAILFGIQNYIPGHIFRAIVEYLRIFQIWAIVLLSEINRKCKNPQIFTEGSKNVSEYVILDADQDCIAV